MVSYLAPVGGVPPPGFIFRRELLTGVGGAGSSVQAGSTFFAPGRVRKKLLGPILGVDLIPASPELKLSRWNFAMAPRFINL